MKSLFLIEYDSLAFLRRKIENFYYDEESHWINRLRSYTSSIIFKRHFKRTSLSVLSMMRVLIIYNRGGTMYVWYPKIVGLLDFLQYYSIQCSISINNGANRGLKAVLHVLNKFGAGQKCGAHTVRTPIVHRATIFTQDI